MEVIAAEGHAEVEPHAEEVRVGPLGVSIWLGHGRGGRTGDEQCDAGRDGGPRETFHHSLILSDVVRQTLRLDAGRRVF